MNISRKEYCFLGLVTLVFLFLTIPRLDRPFDWDEVDYVNAAKLGFLANYAETTSLNIQDFLLLSQYKYKNLPLEETGIFSAYREEQDTFLLRHYHPPSPMYLYTLFGGLSHFDHTLTRLPSLIFGLLTLYLLYFGSRLLFPKHGKSVGTFATLLHVINPIASTAATGLWFHSIATFFFLLTVVLFVRAFQTKQKKHLYWACTALAFSFVTLESSYALILAALLCFFFLKNPWWQWKPFHISKEFFKAWGLFLLLIALLWPGYFLTFVFVKFVFYHIYRLFISGQVYVGSQQAWLAFFQQFQLFWLLWGIGTGYFFFRLYKKKLQQTYWTILLFLVPLFAMSYRFFLTPQHVLPLLTLFALLGGYLLSAFVAKKPRYHYWAFGILLLLAGFSTAAGQYAYGDASSAFYAQLAFIREQIPPDALFLVDGGHIYRHYLPEYWNIVSITANYVDDSISIRQQGAYSNINAEIQNKMYPYLLLQKRPGVEESTIVQFITQSCRQLYEDTVFIFSCDTVVPGQRQQTA